MSFINVLPIPLVPPRSPKKNSGPKPTPTSTFPLPKVIDWEKILQDKETKMETNTIARIMGTHLFIDIRFSVLLLDLRTKNRKEQKSNQMKKKVFFIVQAIKVFLLRRTTSLLS